MPDDRDAAPVLLEREDQLASLRRATISASATIVSGERWAAEAHRIAQSTPSPADGIDGGSFDWQDAGAGAFAALALVALLGVGAYGLHSRTARHPASGAAS